MPMHRAGRRGDDVMGFWRDMQRDSYKVSRLSGDINAAEKGTLLKRLF